ncbi:hypothetical protein [Thalassotalea fusca]
MIRLSKTGWNNVIIFSVMAYILLINMTNNSLFTGDAADEQIIPLLGENAVILTLTINQSFVVERIGRTWRANPATVTGQALDQMMMAWHDLTANIVSKPPEIDTQLGLIVSVALAGEQKAMVLQLFATDEQLLVYNRQSETWYALPIQRYAQLIPEGALQ